MKLRPFELALIIIFGSLAILAMILFMVLDFSSDDSADSVVLGPVEIWGTLPREAVEATLSELVEQNESYRAVTYRQLVPESFSTELTTALADGAGPDVLLLPHEYLVEQRRRIQPISYEAVPRRDIDSLYIDGAAIFALSDGVYALPLFVDPLMMYWNKTLLANQNFLGAPKTWEELVSVQFPTLIDRNFSRAVNRSVVAMGTYSNVRNAFGVLSMLTIQGGSQRVTENQGAYTVSLDSAVGQTTQPLRSALDFYLRFAQPTNTLYSWNRSFTEDRAQFVSEDLVFYFGYGSEGKVIEQLNPNLAFDIAEVPQGAGATTRRTYGTFYGAALLRSADNVNGAYSVMTALSSAEVAKKLADRVAMVPVHRSLVGAGSNDEYGRYTYLAAPVAYGWLNPSVVSTDKIFTDALLSVSENRANVSGATTDVLSQLRASY